MKLETIIGLTGLSLLFVLLISTLAIFVIQFRKRKLEQKLSNELLKREFENQLLESQIEIQETTFKNISQELHDNIGQSITLSRLQLNSLKKTVDAKTEEKLVTVTEYLNNSLAALRDIAKSLLGEKVVEIGIIQAIKNEFKFLEQAQKYEIELTTKGTTFELSPQKTIISFRIIQEGISNIVKHAQATKIICAIIFNEQTMQISLHDNGKGFDSSNNRSELWGIGLKNMTNRAKLIGADLTIDSKVFYGTSLTLTVDK